MNNGDVEKMKSVFDVIELGENSASKKLASIFKEDEYIDIWEKEKGKEGHVSVVRLTFDEIKMLIKKVEVLR